MKYIEIYEHDLSIIWENLVLWLWYAPRFSAWLNMIVRSSEIYIDTLSMPIERPTFDLVGSTWVSLLMLIERSYLTKQKIGFLWYINWVYTFWWVIIDIGSTTYWVCCVSGAFGHNSCDRHRYQPSKKPWSCSYLQ